MARYIREVKMTQPIDVVSMIVEDYVYHYQFRRSDWNGEMVYFRKDGHGKECYMKWNYTNGVFHIEAWLKNAFGGEADLNGSGVSKNEFRKSLEKLITTLQRQHASTVSSGHVGADPLHHTDNHAAEHRAQQRGSQMSFGTMPTGNPAVRTPNRNVGYLNPQGARTGRASANISEASALIYAVIALIFGSIPIVGILIAISCLKKIGGNSGGTYRVAQILCVIALVISVFTVLGNIILPAMLMPMLDFF